MFKSIDISHNFQNSMFPCYLVDSFFLLPASCPNFLQGRIVSRYVKLSLLCFDVVCLVVCLRRRPMHSADHRPKETTPIIQAFVYKCGLQKLIYQSRWEDNIRMNLEEICINAGNWVDSAQDRDYWRALVNAALNLRVP